jgi:hypothetical protein
MEQEFSDPHHDTFTAGHSANYNTKRHFWIDITVGNSLPQVALEHAIRSLSLSSPASINLTEGKRVINQEVK